MRKSPAAALAPPAPVAKVRYLDLLPPQGAGSADLAAAIDRAEAQAQVSRLAALDEERGVALVDDDDAALDRIEAETAKVRRDLDRSDLAIVELRRRHADALAAERRTRLDAAHARGAAASREGAALIIGEYSVLAERLGAVLDRIDDAETAVAAANRELAAEGDSRRVDHADIVARPRSSTTCFHPPLLQTLLLPSPTDPAATLWPPTAPRTPPAPPSLSPVDRGPPPVLPVDPRHPTSRRRSDPGLAA